MDWPGQKITIEWKDLSYKWWQSEENAKFWHFLHLHPLQYFRATFGQFVIFVKGDHHKRTESLFCSSLMNHKKRNVIHVSQNLVYSIRLNRQLSADFHCHKILTPLVVKRVVCGLNFLGKRVFVNIIKVVIRTRPFPVYTLNVLWASISNSDTGAAAAPFPTARPTH